MILCVAGLAVPSQEKLSMIIDAFRTERYKESLTNLADKARFNAASAPSAGAWLEARPVRDALTVGNDEYRIGCCFTSEFHCIRPDCGQQLDSRGLHALDSRDDSEATLDGEDDKDDDAGHNENAVAASSESTTKWATCSTHFCAVLKPLTMSSAVSLRSTSSRTDVRPWPYSTCVG